MPKIANASRHSLSYVQEIVAGETPDNPQMKAMRHTSCGLTLTRDSFLSEEKRQDRQITDVRTGTNQIGGTIGFEPSLENFDDLFEGCLAGKWADNELKCGTDEISYTFERGFHDIKQYTRYTGCYLNKLNLSIQPNAMVKGSFEVIGMDASNADEPLSPSLEPPKATRQFDSYTGVLKEGDEVIAVVTGIELNLDNGIQPQFVLFRRSAPFVSWGRSNVSGTLTAFFENTDLITKFLDETPTSLEFTLEEKDGAGSYTFILPSIRYTGADNPMDSDGPISITMPFQAVLDDAEGTNLIIRREVKKDAGSDNSGQGTGGSTGDQDE